MQQEESRKVTCKAEVFDPAQIINMRPCLWRVPVPAKLLLQGAAHKEVLTAGSTKWEPILMTGMKCSTAQLQSVFQC